MANAVPIHANLEHFVKTLQLGPIKIGMPRSDVESILGQQSCYAAADDLHVIICDGVVFHCRGERSLHFISVILDSSGLDGTTIAVEHGGLVYGLSIEQTLAKLDDLRLAHEPVQPHCANGQPYAKTIQLHTGADLAFHNTIGTNWRLRSVAVFRQDT